MVCFSWDNSILPVEKVQPSENGGHINLTKEWAKYLLQRTNYVKRHGCSTAKAQFLLDIQSLVEIEEIPSS